MIRQLFLQAQLSGIVGKASPTLKVAEVITTASFSSISISESSGRYSTV